MTKAPTCSLCNREMKLLPNPTDRQALPVFVCAEKVRPKSAPCDGYVIAAQRG